MNIVRKILGTAPTPVAGGAFSPSRLALKLATSPKTDFDGGVYENPYQGGKWRVLMVATEERNMMMANGKTFSTGNHPVETALPMLHFLKAGFEIDVVTPTGAPVAIEHWAMPKEDLHVKTLFEQFSDALNNPGSLADFVENKMTDDAPYIGIFIPGGHGAMLGLPENSDMGKLLRWAHDRDLYTMALCLGPAALLAAGEGKKSIYKGYKISAFPDAVDKQNPMIGYLPGAMPWNIGEKLEAAGMTIVNKKADDTTHIDRRLITGASPKAANRFGRLAATTLLESLGTT